jgi:hypothetical protein
MSTIGVARIAPPFIHGVDALVPFTRAQLQSFKDRFAIGAVGAYVEVMTANPAYRDLIFDMGLAIAPYSEASIGAVDGTTGAVRGAATARMLLDLGGPPGLDLLTDMEDVTGDKIQDYVNARDMAYGAEGYGTLLYVGEPLPAGVTPQLLQVMRPHRYMRSCSKGVPEPIALKWCVLQLAPGNEVDPVLGVHVDHFVVESDALGGRPTWWYPS